MVANTMTQKCTINRILNVYDLQGPQPSIIVLETMKRMKKGEVIEIIGSKFAMQAMYKTLLKKKKYSVLEVTQKQGHTHCIVRVNEVPPPR